LRLPYRPRLRNQEARIALADRLIDGKGLLMPGRIFDCTSSNSVSRNPDITFGAGFGKLARTSRRGVLRTLRRSTRALRRHFRPECLQLLAGRASSHRLRQGFQRVGRKVIQVSSVPKPENRNIRSPGARAWTFQAPLDGRSPAGRSIDDPGRHP
jgi:hypothetical protein